MQTTQLTPVIARDLVFEGDPRIFLNPERGVKATNPGDFADTVRLRLGMPPNRAFVRQLAQLIIPELNGQKGKLVPIGDSYLLRDHLTPGQLAEAAKERRPKFDFESKRRS